MSSKLLFNIGFLVIFVLAMYFLLIRPQKKKEKSVNEMRNNIQVGDEIITIGGICGKVVKTKDETIVVMVGADKLKFEMMRWSISSVVTPAKPSKKQASEEKKIVPKRLKKAEEEAVEEAKNQVEVEATTDAE